MDTPDLTPRQINTLHTILRVCWKHNHYRDVFAAEFGSTACDRAEFLSLVLRHAWDWDTDNNHAEPIMLDMLGVISYTAIMDCDEITDADFTDLWHVLRAHRAARRD